jgi:hypothetical protein
MYISNHTFCENTLFNINNIQSNLSFELFYQSENLKPLRNYKNIITLECAMVEILDWLFNWYQSKMGTEYWSMQFKKVRKKSH